MGSFDIYFVLTRCDIFFSKKELTL